MTTEPTTKHPIPVFGVPANLKPPHPNVPERLHLYWSADGGIHWDEKFGAVATKQQLESEIKRAAGIYLPTERLPALDPGDVVVLAEGIFWIDRDWQLLPYPECYR